MGMCRRECKDGMFFLASTESVQEFSLQHSHVQHINRPKQCLG